MSLLRRSPAPIVERTAAEQAILGLEREIRAHRPSLPPVGLAATQPRPLSGPRAAKVLLLLADLSQQQVLVGRAAEARSTIGEASLVLAELEALRDPDMTAIAHGAVMIGEALLAIDSPKHATVRFERGIEILDLQATEPRWRVRARLGLGRTLVALDDIRGLQVLEDCEQLCRMLGDHEGLLQIEKELREAEKVFDTPRHIHTGYGRPVAVAAPR